MTVSGDYDYASLLNQNKLNTVNGLLGSANNVNVGGGISGDTLQQWSMLGANSAAYRKLLESQETGTVKKTEHYSDLISDKLYNDYYDTENSKVVSATYKPDTSTTASIDSELTAGEHLENMRRLALAAIGNPDGLTSTHYDLFEQMRAAIAGGLKTSSTSDSTEVVTEEAKAATLSAKADFRLLTEQQNFTIAGASGEKTYNFNEGDSLESIAAAINADSAETGVTATYGVDDDGNHVITLNSKDTGADAFVRVDQNVGSLFTGFGSSTSAKGADAVKADAETVATGTDTQAAIAVGLFGGAAFGDETFTIQGNKGSQEFSFAHGTSGEEIIEAINAASEKTGVTAQAIRNAAGEIEGIGLLAEKAGSGQYVQVTQTAGDLFADAGKTVKVSGSSTEASSSGTTINSLEDLGKVTVDGKTYSFADLAVGGGASLEKNPDAALAVLDQTLKDIYAGRAEVKGFDSGAIYISGVTDDTSSASASTNAMSIGDYGSDALKAWINNYAMTDS